MKVMVGFFTTESNEHIPVLNEISSYDLAFGEECVEKCVVGSVFRKNGIEVIPSVYADGGASGVIRRDTFDYIESCFLETVRTHLKELDGIYLHLHGASEVEGLGSGDHHIVKKIREITGPYLPIAVVCDPHGNLCQEYVESLQIIRSYRQAPHTDAEETMLKTAQMLVDLLNDRQNIHSVYRKLPLILGGEQSVSTDEPVKTINAYMDEMEKDPRIRSVSWHVGYIRHDTDVAGCGIVVVPQTEADQQYAEQKADELAKFVWDRRHEFHYTGTTAQPDEAMKMVLDQPHGPCVLTDSGDNATSGAKSWNTFVLRQVLALKDLKKTFLFAAINDPAACRLLLGHESGDTVSLNLGVGQDELSAPVAMTVEIRQKGDLVATNTNGQGRTVVGKQVLVHVCGTTVDIVVADAHNAFISNKMFEYAGITWQDYDVTVVKQGYIFPDLKKDASFYVMSLTDGPTLQDTAHIGFKRVMRPMYPIDEI